MIKYSKLKLLKNDYVALRQVPDSNTIVLQFMLTTQEDIYPKLRAYAMLKKHAAPTTILFRDLTYLNPMPGADLSIVGEQILGDLQVTIPDVKLLLEACNANPNQFDHLVFTPKVGEEKHIVFDITVVPTTIPQSLAPQTLMANPSPPKGAM